MQGSNYDSTWIHSVILFFYFLQVPMCTIVLKFWFNNCTIAKGHLHAYFTMSLQGDVGERVGSIGRQILSFLPFRTPLCHLSSHETITPSVPCSYYVDFILCPGTVSMVVVFLYDRVVFHRVIEEENVRL